MGHMEHDAGQEGSSPFNPASPLKRPAPDVAAAGEAHPPQPSRRGSAAAPRAEEAEQRGPVAGGSQDNAGLSPPKRIKLSCDLNTSTAEETARAVERPKGTAPIKAEYLIDRSEAKQPAPAEIDDDATEAAPRTGDDGGASGKKSKARGQNTKRKFGSWKERIQLCATRAHSPEFSPLECKFGGACKFEHDLRTYLLAGKEEDLQTFGGVCPVWDVRGTCTAGWKCRFVGSHSEERETEDGRKELVLLEDAVRMERAAEGADSDEAGVVNTITADTRRDLSRRVIKTPRSDVYTDWLNKNDDERHPTRDRPRHEKQQKPRGRAAGQSTAAGDRPGRSGDEPDGAQAAPGRDDREENRARYSEPPLLPSEKRRIYYGPETPVLAPLTTQGNLPFRRLCVELGAQVTWSEMAMGLPLIKGEKGEWALLKAHKSETTPPRCLATDADRAGSGDGASGIVKEYDNSRDLKFGAQVAGNKPWLCLKTTETVTALCPRLRAVDLNCGCPIDLVYRQGAGSALLDSPAKLEKILRGMNAVSGDVPVTAKIRMGTKESEPTSHKLVSRLVFGGAEATRHGEGPCGVAAITLHGRSRQQRYTKSADWSYIARCAAVVRRMKEEQGRTTDTAAEPDARRLPSSGRVFFVGNGDCYSHEDYFRAIEESRVDSVMVARGALIKPWIFEEIEKGQYLDKSATERLAYVEKFVKYGLENWGSDEMGVNTTRRFLLEWLSFTYRYVPVALLEHLPPNLQDRPPCYRGRNELETLMASDNYKDWLKISDMFLGPAPSNFQFQPKHRSNSYEIEAEG